MSVQANKLAMVVRAAVLTATRDSSTPLAVLNAILLKNFESSVVGGKTVVSVAEAGGSTTLQFLGELGPAEITALVSEAISWLEQQPDPDNPNVSTLLRRVTRIKATFDHFNPL